MGDLTRDEGYDLTTPTTQPTLFDRTLADSIPHVTRLDAPTRRRANRHIRVAGQGARGRLAHLRDNRPCCAGCVWTD